MQQLEKLFHMLEPSVHALGLELVEIELAGSGHQTVLRIYIDGPDGVTVEDCADVSRQVSAVLDVEDPISGRYTLEVSSPGLDRPLVKPADFIQYVGETIKVKLYEPIDGRSKFKGELTEASEDHIVMHSGGSDHRLEYTAMERARLVPKFN